MVDVYILESTTSARRVSDMSERDYITIASCCIGTVTIAIAITTPRTMSTATMAITAIDVVVVLVVFVVSLSPLLMETSSL
ncbi:MAG: hypothetical protein M3258_04965 [Thermoproteota archaeon]|nr:hypothetical protein [Thermoproteota archaeon]